MVRAREVKESVARTLESELFAASRGIRGLSRPFICQASYLFWEKSILIGLGLQDLAFDAIFCLSSGYI